MAQFHERSGERSSRSRGADRDTAAIGEEGAMTESRHASVVSQWMELALTGPACGEIVPIFGRALLAIWDRAHVTLGEVSLRAITHRVLHRACARFPVLRSLALEPPPESFRALVDRGSDGADRAELLAAIQFVLTELLSLLGTLTAEILSAGLHEALLATPLPAAAASKPLDSNRGARS
jgi:hypothetical protein